MRLIRLQATPEQLLVHYLGDRRSHVVASLLLS